MSTAGEGILKQGPRMEILIGTLLLIGVLTSATLILAGWIWHWISSGKWDVDYTLPRTNLLRFFVQEIREVARGNLNSPLLINWGIIVLFLTPYLRVAMSFFYFIFIERNLKYSALTGFVFVLLTLSLTML